MATYTWGRTREQVVSMVLRKLGVRGEGDASVAEDDVIVIEAIDARLKELHALGILWFQVDGAATAVPLTAGTATAVITADDFLFPVTAMVTVGTDEVPVQIVGHSAYQAIQDKASSGEPERVFIDGLTCYLWPVPQTDATLNLTYQAIVDDTEQSTELDIHASMTRAFVDLVTGDLVDDFSVDEGKARRLLMKQQAAKRDLLVLNHRRIDTAPVEIEAY